MKFLAEPRSGSFQGITSSRNQFGQYVRTRATPVNPNTTFQSTARNRLSSMAQAWDAITDLQRAGWASVGLSMTRTDSLGQVYHLSGFQAYISVNSLNLAVSNARVDDAPVFTTPTGLVTATITLTHAAFSVAYTATPLAAGARLLFYASPQRKPGRTFEHDYRLIQVSAAAAASPANVFAAYSARLGTPLAGNKIFMSMEVYVGGFSSSKLLVAQVVA